MKNKKKVTLLGVAFIAAVIALAGVGYAVTSEYTARTDSASGDIDIDWIALKLNESAYTGPGTFEVVWNERTTGYANSDWVMTFSFVASDEVVQTLTLDKDSSEATTFKLKASGDDFSGLDIYTLEYKVNDGSWTTYKSGELFGNTGIDFVGTSMTITWHVTASEYVYPTGHATTPGDTVIMPGITYNLTASGDA